MRRLSLKSTLFGVDPKISKFVSLIVSSSPDFAETMLLFGRTSERETHQLNPDDEAFANGGVVS